MESQSGSDTDDFEQMKVLLQVFDELGGEAEPEIDDLVVPYRSVKASSECLLKEAPFATAEPDAGKVFLLSDSILIGLDTRKVKKGGGRARTGTLDRKDKKGTLKIRRNTLVRFKGRYKLLHYLDIRNCKVKSIGQDEQGFEGLAVTHISRMLEVTSKNKTGKVMTKIAKLELWFATSEQSEAFQRAFFDALQVLEYGEEEAEGTSEEGGSEQRKPSMRSGRSSFSRLSVSRSTSSTTGGKQRKWAGGRSQISMLDKQPSAVHEDEEKATRSGSIASGGQSTVGESVGGGLQLADLERRYNMELKADVSSDNKAEIEVEFGEGKLGLSLGSGSGIGVIVGALAPGGFAEMAGVLISDRVCAINDEPIELDDHWQDALDKLKMYPRPIRIKFERFGARMDEVMKKNKGQAKVKQAVPKGVDTAGVSRSKMKELDKIAQKAERILDRKESLETYFASLASVPSVSASANKRKMVAVLEELVRTESIYVGDMVALVRTYLLPLRSQRVKTKCRRIEGAGVFCEHGLRSTCLRSASQHQPILSSEELQSIFLNIETILFVNIELLRVLQLKLSGIIARGKSPTLSGTVTTVADAFVTVMPFFKSYSYFCHEYVGAVDKLLVLRKENKPFALALGQIESAVMAKNDSSARVQTLSSLLIKPVQRICRYPLIFHEILKYASSDMAGLSELKAALKFVEHIAESVDSKVGESEQFSRFMEVYQDLGGETGAPGLVEPSRRFVTETDLMIQEEPFQSARLHARTLLLFNDLLIIAKDDNGGGTLRTRSLKRASSNHQASLSNHQAAASPLERGWTFLVNSFSGGSKSETASTSSHHSSVHRSLRSSIRHSSRRSVNHRGPMKRIQRNLKQVHWCKIGGVRLRQDPDNELNYIMTYSERDEEAVKKTTRVDKLKLCFDAKDEQERVIDQILVQIASEKERVAERKVGISKHGKKEQERNWSKKSAGTLKVRVKH